MPEIHEIGKYIFHYEESHYAYTKYSFTNLRKVKAILCITADKFGVSANIVYKVKVR